jgi:sodium transport system permease protein
MPADAALMPSGVQALALALPPANLALMAAAMVALASIFGAVQLTVSLYARSFREAQTYLSPVTLVVVLPAVFIQFIRAADVPGRVFTVPVLNVIFIFKELLEGPVNWTHFGTMLASSFITAYVCLRLMAAVFRNEQVLFRT